MPGLRFKSEEEYAQWKAKLGTVSEESFPHAKPQLYSAGQVSKWSKVGFVSTGIRAALGYFLLGAIAMVVLLYCVLMVLSAGGFL